MKKNRYTIKFTVGTHSGVRVIDAYNDKEAEEKLWINVGHMITDSTDLKKCEILDIETNIFGF